MSPHSQACGTCGVSNQRIVCRPSASSSPSASARGARSAKSPTDTIAATWPQTGTACGAAARNDVERAALVGLEVRQPDVTQPLDRHHGADRLADEREQLAAGRVWNSIGASSTIRYWLKLNADVARQRHRRVDAVDAVGDLVDVGAGLRGS